MNQTGYLYRSLKYDVTRGSSILARGGVSHAGYANETATSNFRQTREILRKFAEGPLRFPVHVFIV